MPNLETLLLARDLLARESSLSHVEISAPGNTCTSALPLLARYGITHAEPGHALTGSTPLHARSTEPEIPAMVYVSEVSHVEGSTAYIFGGGFYRLSQVQKALVGSSPSDLTKV